jgi:hypothetical protein
VTILVCPRCGKPSSDDPDAEATNPDGTGTDTEICFDCWKLDFYGPASRSQDERRP